MSALVVPVRTLTMSPDEFDSHRAIAGYAVTGGIVEARRYAALFAEADAQRARVVLLDAEIVALRKTLGSLDELYEQAKASANAKGAR